ncbi:MAG: hypothetical protein DYG89_33630 [Caldilinea sp. CFX5]|nr:hypothetical protein [Caldilinea sp. CFX5]
MSTQHKHPWLVLLLLGVLWLNGCVPVAPGVPAASAGATVATPGVTDNITASAVEWIEAPATNRMSFGSILSNVGEAAASVLVNRWFVCAAPIWVLPPLRSPSPCPRC